MKFMKLGLKVYDNARGAKIMKSLTEKSIYEAFHVNSPSVAQNSAVFSSCSN